MPSRMNVTRFPAVPSMSRANSVPRIWTRKKPQIHGNAGVMITVRRLISSS